MKLVLVIDAGQIYADWHIVKELAAEQFARRVALVVDRYRPSHTVCAFDSSEPTFRHALCPKYKADRERNDDVREQLSKAADLMTEAGVTCIGVAGFEADDIIATVVDKAVAAGFRTIIYSRDKECHQLLENGKVTILKKYGQEGPEWFTSATLMEKFGLEPDQWIDYQSICGDSTDGVTGVEGIGDKGARKILAGGLSLQGVLANPWSVDVTQKQQAALVAFAERYELVRELVTLRTDVPIDWRPE